ELFVLLDQVLNCWFANPTGPLAHQIATLAVVLWTLLVGAVRNTITGPVGIWLEIAHLLCFLRWDRRSGVRRRRLCPPQLDLVFDQLAHLLAQLGQVQRGFIAATLQLAQFLLGEPDLDTQVGQRPGRRSHATRGPAA